MTSRQAADVLRVPRTVVAPADYDEYLDDAFCPLCGSVVTDNVGTPTVPTMLLDVDVDEDQDELPAFGWRCDCRRAEIAVVAPAERAPESYTPVDVTVDGETTTIAVPAPALEAARPDDHD